MYVYISININIYYRRTLIKWSLRQDFILSLEMIRERRVKVEIGKSVVLTPLTATGGMTKENDRPCATAVTKIWPLRITE